MGLIWFAFCVCLTVVCGVNGTPGWLMAIFIVADLCAFVRIVRRH